MEKYSRCPNSNKYYRIIIEGDEGEKDLTYYTRCGSWSCPFCVKINSLKLRSQISRACKSLWESFDNDGYRLEYFFKFLTLTLPGQLYREKTTIEQAEKDLKYALKRLVDCLRKKFGWFEYVWVMESQADGFPHIHALLVGESIASKYVFYYIQDLWREKYRMGFVKMNIVRGGVNGVAGYITKYITKGMETAVKGQRVFGMSKVFRRAKPIVKRSITVVEFGTVAYDPVTRSEVLIPQWKASGLSDYELKLHCLPGDVSDAVLNELLDYFALMGKAGGYRQASLPGCGNETQARLPEAKACVFACQNL